MLPSAVRPLKDVTTGAVVSTMEVTNSIVPGSSASGAHHQWWAGGQISSGASERGLVSGFTL